LISYLEFSFRSTIAAVAFNFRALASIKAFSSGDGRGLKAGGLLILEFDTLGDFGSPEKLFLNENCLEIIATVFL
jgi:hypothetical protein